MTAAEMKYTGERMVPEHDGKAAQGNIEIHDLMYRGFLVATQGKVVVDIACGCGYGTLMISSRAEKVYGYDIDVDTVEFADEFMYAENIEYNIGDIKNIPHENESIDTVVSVETFEHVDGIDRVISEVHRILKPKGFWCFTTPNGAIYPDPAVVPFHVKHYTKEDIHSLLGQYFNIHISEIGLEPDRSVHMGTPMFGNLSVFALKKDRHD